MAKTNGPTFDDLSLEEKNRARQQLLNDLVAGQASLADLLTLNGRDRGEENTRINIPDLLETFRGQEYAPRASGIRHLFTGGPLFPQTAGQQRAEKLAALGGMLTNVNARAGNPVGGILSSAVSALIDKWNKRRQQGQGGM